jgi:hypothetical protein
MNLTVNFGKAGYIPLAPLMGRYIAGGWSQAGGHAWLSSEHGLGADNIMEYKVVTADGNLTIANEVSNTGLFWALRGGGAGTWGAVVEATMKAYPTPKTISYMFWMNTTEYTDGNSRIPVHPSECNSSATGMRKQIC